MLLPAYQERRSFFDEQAPNWHFPEADRQKITNILESLDLPQNGIIFDAGCGTGNLFVVLKAIAPNSTIIACDMAGQMLAEYRRRVPHTIIPLWLGLCEKLPLKDESLDLILNYCVFPHIRNKSEALSEFRRVLKPGGRYLIIHPQGRKSTNLKHFQIGTPISDDILPAPFTVVNLLNNHNFSIRQVIDCDDLFLIEAAKSV